MKLNTLQSTNNTNKKSTVKILTTGWRHRPTWQQQRLQTTTHMSIKWTMNKCWCYTHCTSPTAVCIAIRGRYTQLVWLANPNLILTLLTLATASRVTIWLAMCIDTFINITLGNVTKYQTDLWRNAILDSFSPTTHIKGRTEMLLDYVMTASATHKCHECHKRHNPPCSTRP